MTSTVKERALQLLGQGIAPSIVASSCGVTESAVSQWVSDPEFAAQIAELRFSNLQKHNERDSHYDSLEDRLHKKMEDLLPLMVRPMEVLKAIQVINQAKRRGASAPDSIIQQQTIIQLNIPTQIIQKFQINSQNMVTQAGDQELLTLQSGTLLNKLKAKESQNDFPKLTQAEAVTS